MAELTIDIRTDTDFIHISTSEINIQYDLDD